MKLTGGTITITPADTSRAETDLFKQLKEAASKYSDEAGLPGQAAVEPTVIDIAELVKDNGGKPIRISTVLRDGSWYPSLFYTVLDYWARTRAPVRSPRRTPSPLPAPHPRPTPSSR